MFTASGKNIWNYSVRKSNLCNSSNSSSISSRSTPGNSIAGCLIITYTRRTQSSQLPIYFQPFSLSPSFASRPYQLLAAAQQVPISPPPLPPHHCTSPPPLPLFPSPFSSGRAPCLCSAVCSSQFSQTLPDPQQKLKWWTDQGNYCVC